MSGDFSSFVRTVSQRSSSSFQLIGDEMLFTGSTTHYLDVPSSSDFAFSADFTVELFGAKFSNNTNDHGLCGFYSATGNQRSWAMTYLGSGSPDTLNAYISSDGINATIITANWTPVVNQAYSLCFERHGSTVRVYVDGVMVASGTHAGALFNSTATMKVGLGFQQTSNAWAGRLKAFRVSRVARYATDTSYTVPTLPLPAQAP